MKRIERSKYSVGSVVVLKKDHCGVCKGHTFRVIDPNKIGKNYCILVEDLAGRYRMYIPTKYLASIK